MRILLNGLMDHAQKRLTVALYLVLLLVAPISYAAAQGARGALFIASGVPVADLTADQARILAKIRGERTAASVSLMRLNALELQSDAQPLELFEGMGVLARLVRSEPRPGGAYVLSSPASSGDSAILLVRGDMVTGRVATGGRVFSVRPLGAGLHAVVQIDQRRFPPEHPSSFERLERAHPNSYSRSERDRPGSADLHIPEIDVLVAFTAGVASATADPEGLAQLSVDQMNRTFANSGIAGAARLVGTAPVAYDDSVGFDAAVANLLNPGDGKLDELHPLRNTTGADIVALLIDNHEFCGLAAAILANPDTAFTAIDYSCAVDNVSFSHELGHLLGARHNPEADPTVTPYAYGHGLQQLAGPWRTVMAYPCDGLDCPRIEVWSNPFVTIGGQPAGTQDVHFNAKVLAQTLPVVESFRFTQGCRNALTSAVPVPDGFGAAYNVHSQERELTLQGLCEPGKLNLFVGSGRVEQYIYRQGLAWNGAAWEPIEYKGTELIADTWWRSWAVAPRPEAIPGANYFLAFVCTDVGGVVKCGCRDAACATSTWQLQSVERQ